MLSAIRLLLDHRHADDATFSTIVAQVGGPEQAQRLLLDRTKELEVFGTLEDFVAVIAAADRVEDLAGRER
jgi:hypothetical protein